jgi:hypothetical protein
VKNLVRDFCLKSIFLYSWSREDDDHHEKQNEFQLKFLSIDRMIPKTTKHVYVDALISMVEIFR